MPKDINQNLYDIFWGGYKIPDPDFWPHWEVIKHFQGKRCLEIGSGTKPRIPVKNNYFLDISSTAVERLKKSGGKAKVYNLSSKIPFKSNTFDLVCAFEVLEHLKNDPLALKEIARVLKHQGILFISFPLKMNSFNEYDISVGHFRRYEPSQLEKMFKVCNLKIVQYAGLYIPWPNKITGHLAAFMIRCFPNFVSKLTNFLDSLPNTAVRQPIDLSPWGKDSSLLLEKFNTGIFICEKLK